MNALIALPLLVLSVVGGEDAATTKRDASLWCIFAAEVSRVIDGDTVVVDAVSDSICANALKEKSLSPHIEPGAGGGGYSIRLIGVNTPERGEKGFKKAGRFALKWFRRNPQFLIVYTELNDEPTHGEFGRLLGVIMPVPVEGQPTVSLNAELVAEGLAEAVHFKHNDSINFLEWQIRQNSANASSKPTAP